MIWTRRIVAVLSVAVIVWGLFQYAGKFPQVYYRLFLFALFPAMIAAVRLPLPSINRTAFTLLLLVGAFFLFQIVLQPTLTGHGYVRAALGWLALCLTLFLTGGQPGSARVCLLFLVLVGGVEALYGLTQSLGPGGDLAKGSFTNRNHFAGLLNMTIPLAMGGLFAHYAGAKERLRSELLSRSWIVLLSCGFMALGVLLSLSRAGSSILILTIVFLGTLLVIRPKRALGPGRRSLSAAAAWILLFVTLGMGAWVGMEALIGRFGNLDFDRPVVYADTLELISHAPILGTGPGMYRWRFRPHQSIEPGSWFDHAHNDYLESAVDWGIPLALFFWGFVLWRFWRSIVTFLGSADPWRRGIGLGCAGAIFSILVHSLVDFNLQIPVNLMIFSVILGLSWACDSGE